MTGPCERPGCEQDRKELDSLHATWRGNPTKTYYVGIATGFLPPFIVLLLVILYLGGIR